MVLLVVAGLGGSRIEYADGAAAEAAPSPESTADLAAMKKTAGLPIVRRRIRK